MTTASTALIPKLNSNDSRAKAALESAGLGCCWATYEASLDAPHSGREETTISDIVGKLVRYGSISERQVAFLRSLVGQISRRAEREAERAKAAPCPSGRTEVTGEVVSVKLHDSPYGATYKMTVKSDQGFLVWATCPRSVEKGDRITFSATVTPSDRDDKFGFGKRPTLLARAAGGSGPMVAVHRDEEDAAADEMIRFLVS